MGVSLLRFPHKAIRALVIRSYMERAGYDKAVCFSCGNAARALQAAGVDTLHIGPEGDLAPRKWFNKAEIEKAFPGYFDATSGNLPVELMLEVGKRYKALLGKMPADVVYVPTGSGETLVCLKMAYPDNRFAAVYNLDNATAYEEGAPLNRLVELLAHKVIYADKCDWRQDG